ncbi:MAG TPA: flagellar hook-associated protein FlgL [Sideroxyarcus sp.]|nr:flagellar hook-associated protein FlgL [Sideroxyarcus sp.]
MRISTSSLYSDNIATLNTLQTQIGQTQQQISTGRRLLNPADDPAGAARAAELTQTDAANTQLAANRNAAINTLSLSEGILQNVTELLQHVRTVAIDAGNGTLSSTSRQGMVADLQGRLQSLIGLANSTDGAGNYLYSGSQGKVQAFADTAAGVVYQGDDVQRNVQAAPSRQIATSDSGADIFMRSRNGNGMFQAAVGLANTGTGVISQGTVPGTYNGHTYQIAFTSATQYDVTDVTTGLPVSAGNAYVSGQAISFNGIQFDIKGAPAAGDTFDIKPSTNQSVFTTLGNLIATISAGVATGMSSTAYRQGLSDNLAALDQNLNSVLAVRATQGSRLNELDALQATGEELGLQYKQTLSKLQDTDYNKAVTDLTMQQMMLQASQQSFAKVAQMSLFNYL